MQQCEGHRLRRSAGFYSLHLRGLSDPRIPVRPEHNDDQLLSVEGRLFEVQNHSKTILSSVLHICASTSIVLACAYTATALALPFSWGAMAGAVFYLVLLLIIWD